jgi:DnaK suppressor protein
MSYSKEELKNIESRIKAEIESTQETIETFRELTKPISPENAIGRVSRMDAINNKGVNDSTLNKAELKLKNLEIALTKINEPDFGKCRLCKSQIPIGRILLLPQITICVNCASRL